MTKIRMTKIHLTKDNGRKSIYRKYLTDENPFFESAKMAKVPKWQKYQNDGRTIDKSTNMMTALVTT